MAMENDDPASRDDEPDAYDELHARFTRWNKELSSHWSEWLVEAKDCFNLVAGHQWDKDDITNLKAQEKVPVTFNRLGPVIDAVCGAEILGRQEVKYYPRTMGDVKVNEILTRGAEWIRDLCDAAGQESEAFRDAFICGLGATETRMDFEEDPEGRIIIEACEAMKVLPDPNARKPNAEDARYLRYRNEMSRDEFEELYPGKTGVFDPNGEDMPRHSSDPRRSYSSDDNKGDTETVSVDLWQWYDTETVHIVASPDGASTLELTSEQFEELNKAAETEGVPMKSATRKRRRYMEAVCSGRVWLVEPRELAHGKFRFKFVTGKRDKVKGGWYGLVRPMADPQKWANNFFSMVLHIIRTNAKGGVVAERGAIGDEKKFKESWAKSDAVTVVEDGALQANRMQPKTPPPIPPAFNQLFEQSVTAIRDTSGVSAEMMGLVEINQPGVLEHQRKQASYGILATFFEAFRRYRKFQGELLLDMMKDLPPGTLVRVVGEDGDPKMVQLTMDPSVSKYDVIVDEAPAGPNQKDKTWQMLMQILPIVKDGMTPDLWAEILPYSPLPESLANKLREKIVAQAQAAAQPQADPRMQIEMEQGAANIRKTHAEADQAEVKTQLSILRPDPNPQTVM